MPRNAKDCWQIPKARRGRPGFSSKAVIENMALPVDFRLLAFRTVRQYISIVLSHPVCGALV